MAPSPTLERSSCVGRDRATPCHDELVWHSRRWILGSVAAAVLLGVLVYVETRTQRQFVATNGGPNFETALLFSIGVASIVTLVAARVYLRRKPPFRFGPLGTTIMLAPLWGVIAFVLFDRIYWGY